MEHVELTSVCSVLDGKRHTKYLCYSHTNSKRVFSICLTDAVDVWNTEYPDDTLAQFRHTFALKSADDYVLKLRSACAAGNVSVTVNDSSAHLQVTSGSCDLSLSLRRLPGPRAAEELRGLLFRMADLLTQVGSSGPSPVKSHRRHNAELEPRQQRSCGPSATVKRRAPGASLINPGTKKKIQATGVAFDDADED